MSAFAELSTEARTALLGYAWPGARCLETMPEDQRQWLPEWQMSKQVMRYATVLGPVIALSETGIGTIRTAAPGLDPDWILGPSAVTDRAYQVEALDYLKGEGYAIYRHVYKVKGLRKAGHTRQIKHFDILPAGYPAELRTAGLVPRLYATVAQGGITPAGVKAKAPEWSSLALRCQHPVVIAVPRITAQLAVVQAKIREQYRNDIVRFIEIPTENSNG